MKIKVDVPNGKSGDWEVKTFKISNDNAKKENLRFLFNHQGHRSVEPGTYKMLTRDNNCIMSNTSAEIGDLHSFFRHAKGSVLINGLGLGIALKHILTFRGEDYVTDITVIEKSLDVIKLVRPYFAKDRRVIIVNDDAFTWKPPKGNTYNAVWHDIWDTICEDNLQEMGKLHRKYGRRCEWQGSWCKEDCLASRERSGSW